MESIISLTAVLLLYSYIVTSIDDDFYVNDDLEDITDDAAATSPNASTAQLQSTRNDTFADPYDDIEENSLRPELYGTHITRGFAPPFAMSRQIGMKSQEVTEEKSSSPYDTANEEADKRSAQAYFPPVMQVQEYTLDEKAYKSTTSTPNVARRRDSPLLFIDDYYKRTAEEDRKRRELLEQGYEKYQNINFKRGRNIVPVDLFFDVNPEIRPAQFEPKAKSYVPFAVARSYKTLQGNDAKILHLIDETAHEPGSGELPQKILAGTTIVVNEVPDQHIQDDLEVMNSIEPDLQPNPAETFPKEIYRIYDEVQQGASRLQMPSVNGASSLIEQREEKEKVYDGKAPETSPIHETSTTPATIKSFESMRPLPLITNLTATSTTTNMFIVRPEFATPLLFAISDLVQDDYAWEDKGEWRPEKSPAIKKKSSGVLGWRGVFRDKRTGAQQQQDLSREGMLNEKRSVVIKQVRGKEEMLPTQKFSLLRQASQRMNYQHHSKQKRHLRREKVNSSSKTVRLHPTNKISSTPHKQHSVKRTLEYGGQRTRSGVSTRIRFWNQGGLSFKQNKVRRSCKC